MHRLREMDYADATLGLRRLASTTNSLPDRAPSNSGWSQISSSAVIGAGQTPGRQTVVSRDPGDHRLTVAS